MKSTKYTVTLDDTNLHYWTYGSSKDTPLIVIHGFRGTHHGLEYIIEHLKGYYVITPDLPGFGDTPAFKQKSHSIENFATVVNKLIDSLGVKRPILLGHSMGTVVAAEMVKQRPDSFDQLILVNSVAKKPPMLQLFPGYAYHRIAGKYLPESLGTAILKNKQLFLLGSTVMTKTKDKNLRKLIHWNHVTYMKRFANRKSLLESFESANSTALDRYVDYLSMPTLMIVGKQDTIAPLAHQREVAAKLPQATLVELDDVGHIIHYEKPHAVAHAIRNFLQ